MIDQRGARLLCAAIIGQAIDDYADMIRRDIESAKENKLTYGIVELDEFFDDEWCDALVQDGLQLRLLRGSDLVRSLRDGTISTCGLQMREAFDNWGYTTPAVHYSMMPPAKHIGLKET